jgi:hypothetical protein
LASQALRGGAGRASLGRAVLGGPDDGGAPAPRAAALRAALRSAQLGGLLPLLAGVLRLLRLLLVRRVGVRRLLLALGRRGTSRLRIACARVVKVWEGLDERVKGMSQVSAQHRCNRSARQRCRPTGRSGPRHH